MLIRDGYGYSGSTVLYRNAVSVNRFDSAQFCFSILANHFTCDLVGGVIRMGQTVRVGVA